MASGESQIFKVMSKYELTVTVMSVVLPLISSGVPSLYHVMLEGGEPCVWQTRVIAVLLGRAVAQCSDERRGWELEEQVFVLLYMLIRMDDSLENPSS